MEVIKIIFFALGTFFGVENSQIACEKTIVTVNPTTKTITVVQENLFYIFITQEDSLRVSNELQTILKNKDTWRPELKSYTSKTYQLYVADNGHLNAKIVLNYNTQEDLKAFAIDLNKENEYSLNHFPRWNLSTSQGLLEKNYWRFDANKSFTFVLEPFKEIPNEYKIHKKSLRVIWETINKQNE